jgi:hypothetical protein
VLLLRTLSWGPLHGYAISRWIREHSGEEFQVEERGGIVCAWS